MALFALVGGIVVSIIYAWPITVLMLLSVPIFVVFSVILMTVEFGFHSGTKTSAFANAT